MAETIQSSFLTTKSNGLITNAAVTGRDFEYYCTVFGYTPENLKGLLILDIGSGDSNFSSKAKAYAKVINLDPSYFSRRPENPSASVIGLAQNLPFQSNTFDETIASWSLWNMSNGLDIALREMIRVTKPNGKIRVNPTIKSPEVGFSNAISFKEREDGLSHRSVLTIVKNPNCSQKDWDRIIKELLPCVDLNLEDAEITKKQAELQAYL